MENAAEMTKEYATTKSFDYKKMGMSLNFTLNINKRDQMIAFREMLEQGLKDVKDQIDLVEEKE